ncbi:SMI1/KNR4 family protein [Weizmannia sp. CD-2023]|uniref:SMI1/KNR4 family protein n=2 Tax=Bacillaceae TaxID=186817 RepID=UPI002E1A3F57|nr:SMI1/KNR4 family protein [Weizmannia sp. CD-2023]MED4840513.1 SMI1/KNR4 family protein [Weizmannia sp. CD-2023]MED4902792.1 SMI1/KNR4 family protein [Weizmannia sp. CD-2023]MED4978110.1 SMI1/KNR4 family protein [Weizmannia sp. CD-2023]
MSRLEWQFADEPVSKDYVEKIGNNLGFKFPKDYISCVAVNNGANVEPEIFNVGNREKVFGTLLSFDKGNDEFIVDVYNSYKKTLPNGVVPFAFDPAGNLICFDYKNHEDNPIVVFWEHENAWEKDMLIREEGLTEEQAEEHARENIFYVAATFTEFLDKLHD